MPRLTATKFDARRLECKAEIERLIERKYTIRNEEDARLVTDVLSIVLENSRKKLREYIAAAK